MTLLANAVIAYFWRAWHRTLFASPAVLRREVALLVLPTALTIGVGYP
jgi:hypothetical protein